MTDEFEFPSMDAAKSVLKKLGIEPESRFNEFDQDFEYTSCKIEELERYFVLYNQDDTTLLERRVLGCFLMEGLNDFVSINEMKHSIQDEVFEVLHRDVNIHRFELDYRTDTDGQNEDEWWPICKYILEWRRT